MNGDGSKGEESGWNMDFYMSVNAIVQLTMRLNDTP